MIPRPIREIALSDLQALVGIAREDKTLEFKAEMPGRAEGEVAPFLAGVSSFANTIGGDFVLGVVARDGLAEVIPGVAIGNLDKEKLRIENLLANGLEPRLPRVDIQPVETEAGRHVLIVRTPRSWVGPHRVKANSRFYGRNSAGKYPLDVGELRMAFVLGESVAERVRAFRDRRIAGMGVNETPVPLAPGGRAVLHVIPFPPFADRRDIDVVQALIAGTSVPLPIDGMSGPNREGVNLDGFLNYVSNGSFPTKSYVQFFRNGAIESVSVLEEDEDRRRPYISGTAFTNKIILALRQYLDVLASYEMGLPIFAFVTLTGVAECTLRHNSGRGGGYMVAGRQRSMTITLPEVMIENTTVNVPSALKPMFNALWNAFGVPKCDMYDGQGNWLGHS